MSQAAADSSTRIAELTARVSALEGEVAYLREQLEEAGVLRSVRKSLVQIQRGEGIPLREMDARFRKKFNLPAR